MQNASYDLTKMTHAEYQTAFAASVAKLSPVWGNQHLDAYSGSAKRERSC